jgi:general secretion pathway protein C
VASADAGEAHAIIADGSGKDQVYFLRDPIPGGATLQQVRVDRVILNRRGTLEALRLPREFEASPAAQNRRTVRRSTATPTVQQVVQQNAASFTDVVRPQPYMPNGQLKGYRIYPGRNRQQFAALGLRPGDLVTAINGMSLNNPTQGMQLFRSLGDATQVSLTVERNGEEQTMTLDTTQMTNASEGTR